MNSKHAAHIGVSCFTNWRSRRIIHRKSIWRMPRQWTTMKDAAGGDTLRGGVEQPLIRRFPNGETLFALRQRTLVLQGTCGVNPAKWNISVTGGKETNDHYFGLEFYSLFPVSIWKLEIENWKFHIEDNGYIPLVVASEKGGAQTLSLWLGVVGYYI